MKHTHRNTIIKELSSEEFNELNSRKVYQVEFVGRGTYNVYSKTIREAIIATKELNQYLVEWEVQE